MSNDEYLSHYPNHLPRLMEEIKERAGRKSSDAAQEVFVPRKDRQLSGPVRIAMDFKNPKDMLGWLEAARGVSLPADVSIFEMDALDASFISSDCTFIVKRNTDRPDEFRVHIRTTEENGA